MNLSLHLTAREHNALLFAVLLALGARDGDEPGVRACFSRLHHLGDEALRAALVELLLASE